MADAVIRLLTIRLSGLPTASPDQRPALSRRSSSISSISSVSTSSSSQSFSPTSHIAEATELQPWVYSPLRRKLTVQDEVERKRVELRIRRAREAEAVWREFWG